MSKRDWLKEILDSAEEQVRAGCEVASAFREPALALDALAGTGGWHPMYDCAACGWRGDVPSLTDPTELDEEGVPTHRHALICPRCFSTRVKALPQP